MEGSGAWAGNLGMQQAELKVTAQNNSWAWWCNYTVKKSELEKTLESTATARCVALRLPTENGEVYLYPIKIAASFKQQYNNLQYTIRGRSLLPCTVTPSSPYGETHHPVDLSAG